MEHGGLEEELGNSGALGERSARLCNVLTQKQNQSKLIWQTRYLQTLCMHILPISAVLNVCISVQGCDQSHGRAERGQNGSSAVCGCG